MNHSEDYKKGWNDALEKALKEAKLLYTSDNITFGDRHSLFLNDLIRNMYGTIYIDRKSIMKLKKK